MTIEEQERQDQEKFNAVIMSLGVVKETFYFSSPKHRKLGSDVKILIDKIIKHIKDNA